MTGFSQSTRSRRATTRAENWELVERWCEHYPDDWRLLFKRPGETLEVRVPEDVWRAFDRIVLVSRQEESA